MTKRKYIVLGANGFLGRKISEHLMKCGYEIESLGKEKLDFLNEGSFRIADFSDSLIIDCIARISGNEEDIKLTNNKGFETFLKYLKREHHNFTYIYFSTLSTIFPNLVLSSDYIKSKFNAECFLKNCEVDYKIIRLSFLIGRGEPSDRLFPRLIKKLKANEKLIVNNIKINITPVDSLLYWFPSILESAKEINFTDGQIYSLYDMVNYLANELSSHSKIIFNKSNETSITFNFYKKGMDFRSCVFETLNNMIHEN